MKQKSQFDGFDGLKMFTNIIYYFGILEKIAHFSYQDENRTK
jgi:hypothetical protein